MATRYITGEFMEEDWHLFLNQNFEDIGEDMTAVEDRLDTVEGDVDDLTPLIGHDHSGETVSPDEIGGAVADGYTITNLVGSNLGVDGSGNLFATFDGEEATPEAHGNDVHDPNMALQSDHSSLQSDHDTLRSDFDGHDHDSAYAPSSVESDLSTLQSDFDSHDHDGDYLAAGASASDVGAASQSDLDSHTGSSSAHHSKYSDQEARQAVDDASVSVDFWDGYELVFDNETPETNQYIRLETE